MPCAVLLLPSAYTQQTPAMRLFRCIHQSRHVGTAPRTVSVRSQSNKRYASRYTRDDTQEINSRRGTSTWDDSNDYSSRNNGDTGDAGAWGRDSYYDQRDRNYEAPRDNGNSWSSNYDDRRDYEYDRRDSYDRDVYRDSSSRDSYSSYSSSNYTSSYDRPAPSYPGFTGAVVQCIGCACASIHNLPAEVMSFTGSAPEILNGRLAMLEVVSAEPVAIQFWEAPVPILSAIGTVTVASLMPILRDAPVRAYGPLTPYVELVNARSAMIGFALLVIIETFTGRALFAL